MIRAQAPSKTIVSSKLRCARIDGHAESLRGIRDYGRQGRKSIQFLSFQSICNARYRPVRAMADGGQSAQVVKKAPTDSSLKTESVEVIATITISRKMKEKIFEKIDGLWESYMNRIGQGLHIQLISEEIDPVISSGKILETSVRSWSQPSEHPYAVEYTVNISVPYDFGPPGAILITNLHDKELYLVEIVLYGFEGGRIRFPANTWIHAQKDDPESRIIFKNQAYLPSQSPLGIKDLRCEDLLGLRGNGKHERKSHERIYDYDVYNDLGNPDKSEDFGRPILGGEKRPYPRRCRTGRPPTRKDPFFETRVELPNKFYVPRDEDFGEVKEISFSSSRLKGLLHNLIPRITAAMSHSDLPLDSFSDIDKLYNDGVIMENEKRGLVKNNFEATSENDETQGLTINKIISGMINPVSAVSQRLLKFDLPATAKGDKFSWLRDSELGRQAVAGVNPVSIELLKEIPIISKLDPAVYGPPESEITRDHIEQELNGMSIEEALETKKLFILDYHDILLPFIEMMNSVPERKAYASRTIFFHTPWGTLNPIVIELSLPPKPFSRSNKKVLTSGHAATSDWMWRLAKSHVCSNDASIHQYVNHWLRIHACSETYILATHRQLSSMHPIFKLLSPHMRYTLEINAISRQSLMNAGGILEDSYAINKFGLELSAEYYKSMWRFDMEGLPADLLRRGMAVEDATETTGVRLVVEDYPYAADGLLIWSAIKELVESYVNHYYKDQAYVNDDFELQAWWSEIKNKGHQDIRGEPWWPKLKTKEDLSGILTTMIWTASGQHAVINFSQYHFGSYVPYRPAFMRKLIPQENDPEFENFLHAPERYFFNSLPTRLEAAKLMAVQENASTHSPDEEYLVQLQQLHGLSNNDPGVPKLFEKFTARLKEIENIITSRNNDQSLKNRCGAGVAPYEQLLPSSGPGLTGRGIPNSISL